MTCNDIDRRQVKTLNDVMCRGRWPERGLGQKSALFIRGNNTSHVLVLIKGIRLNQAGVSGFSDLSQIPLPMVQKKSNILAARVQRCLTRMPPLA